MMPRVSLSLSLFSFLSNVSRSVTLSHSLSLVVAKVKEAQRERAGSRTRERRRGSKQISVLPGRPPAKVCLGLEGMKEGGAHGWGGWYTEVGVMGNDVIPFLQANKTEWPVRSGSVRAVKFNKVVL